MQAPCLHPWALLVLIGLSNININISIDIDGLDRTQQTHVHLESDSCESCATKFRRLLIAMFHLRLCRVSTFGCEQRVIIVCMVLLPCTC